MLYMPVKRSYKKKVYKRKTYKKKRPLRKKRQTKGRTVIPKYLMSNTMFVKLKAQKFITLNSAVQPGTTFSVFKSNDIYDPFGANATTKV